MSEPSAMIRWTCLLLVALAVGPAAGMVMAQHGSFDGSGQATALAGGPVVGGALALVAVVVMSVVVAGVASRVSNATTGLIAAATVLAWAGWRSGQLDHILRAADTNPMWLLTVEAAIVAAAMVGIGAVSVWAGRGGHHADGVGPDGVRRRIELGTLGQTAQRLREEPRDMVIALVAAVALGGVNLNLFALGWAHGHALGAGLMAGLFAAAVARALAPSCPILVPLAALALLLPIAAGCGAVMLGQSPPMAVAKGALLPMSRLVPLDVAAGMLMGVPIGRSVGDGFARQPGGQADAARARA